MRKVNRSQLSFEYGDVYICGELYGSETDFFQDVDDGKIEIIEDQEQTSNHEQ